jgi:hypothetical protein
MTETHRPVRRTLACSWDCLLAGLMVAGLLYLAWLLREAPTITFPDEPAPAGGMSPPRSSSAP